MVDVYILYVDKYGDDWEDSERYPFLDFEEAKKFKSEYLAEYKDVSGIEHMEAHIEKITESKLRNILSVAEYCELFPGLEKALNDYFNK